MSERRSRQSRKTKKAIARKERDPQQAADRASVDSSESATDDERDRGDDQEAARGRVVESQRRTRLTSPSYEARTASCTAEAASRSRRNQEQGAAAPPAGA
jgi:hypothetical protein